MRQPSGLIGEGCLRLRRQAGDQRMLTRGVTLPRNRRFPFFAGFSGSVALSMPLGLHSGAALQSFQAGDLLALFADRLFQGSDFAKQLNQQSFKLRAAQIGK